MNNSILDYIKEKERADKLQSILLKLINEPELKLAEHLYYVEEKNRKLKHEITIMREKAEEFNRLLYATGLIVNCTGCDAGKPFDGENLTEDKVKKVEEIAKRLRAWFGNNEEERTLI